MPKAVFSDAYALMLETLIAARREQRVTQVELAERIGRPQQFVSSIERGGRRLDVIEFYALARALKLDPADLFSRVAARLPARVEI